MDRAHPASAHLVIAALLAAAGCVRLDAPPGPEASMQTTTIDADQTPRMQVERIGSGAPLVLIGGGLTGSASWEPHAARLADSRDVARLQLLSVQYGLEDRRLPDGYSAKMESRGLMNALDGLGWTRPVDLVAWSYGALVALDFALDHPERVRTLTLIEPPALWTLPDRGRTLPDARDLAAAMPRIEDDDVSTAQLEAFLRAAALVPPGTEPSSLPQWESWVRHRRSLRNGRVALTHSDDPDRLRVLRTPVLLVTGHGTSDFLRAVHHTLATTLPNARTLELPGGHAPHIVAIERFIEELEQFHRTAATQEEMLAVRSRDGTRIAFSRSGNGPALLLVHGATADHSTTWRPVRSDLERRFTVYAMDRRGRGDSGDAPDYDLQREAEDVAAVTDAIGEPVSVLGHSYGALAAIEAARLTTNIHRLILYEGVPLRGSDAFPPDAADRLHSLLRAGDLDGVLITMYRDIAGLSAAEIDMLRAQHDAWARRLANAHTLPRELEAGTAYTFVPDRFANVRAPTLLLVGGDSPDREIDDARGVAAALPDAQIAVLPGQQHAAMYTAPTAFVEAVVRFLQPEP